MEQERREAQSGKMPLWYQTDAAKEEGLREEVLAVFEQMLNELEREIVPEIEWAVSACVEKRKEL